MKDRFQVTFDGGHQQRYFPDRAALLRYVLNLRGRVRDGRFEVHRAVPVEPMGVRFEHLENIDARDPETLDRLVSELISLEQGEGAPRERPGEPA